jgi:hypothetical protein
LRVAITTGQSCTGKSTGKTFIPCHLTFDLDNAVTNCDLPWGAGEAGT